MLLACLLPLLFGKRLLPRMLGDFDALLPRKRGEMGLCAALVLNAGVGEKIFFRALMPLALWRLTGDAVTAVLAESLLFALMQTYQGVAAVAATGVLGLVLAAVLLKLGPALARDAAARPDRCSGAARHSLGPPPALVKSRAPAVLQGLG
jgi:membrane protease YdiL (CAAX protease family)